MWIFQLILISFEYTRGLISSIDKTFELLQAEHNVENNIETPVIFDKMPTVLEIV